MPWLGASEAVQVQEPVNGTVYSTCPVVRLSTWKPQVLVEVVNISVCLPLTVNGRIPLTTGPAFSVTWLVVASTTCA